MPARKLIITLVASGLLLFGIGAVSATANDDPAPPATACSQQDEQGTVEQEAAEDVAAAATEVADEADNEQADDEGGDEQGENEDADEPDAQCGDQGDDD